MSLLFLQPSLLLMLASATATAGVAEFFVARENPLLAFFAVSQSSSDQNVATTGATTCDAASKVSTTLSLIALEA